MRVLTLLLCFSLVAATAEAQKYLDCHLVPGWEQSGDPRSYTPENLYDYRDGAAEGYLIFGFARMQGIDCKSGTVTLSIDVSEMEDADSAWGMFAANRDPKQPILPLGMGGQVLPQSLLLARGRWFVEIVETDGNTATNQATAIQAFAAKMLPLLDGQDTPPEPIQWFPADQRTSVRLVPQSVLGLRVLRRGYVASYEQGQAFIVIEDSSQAAAEIMKKLRERFDTVTPAQIFGDAFQGKVPYLDGICIFRKGHIVAGYTNLPDANQAASRAAQLAARLPAN
jgi:hypothetical protein